MALQVHGLTCAHTTPLCLTPPPPPTQPCRELLDTVQGLERHMKDMQDCEFTVQDGQLFMLQTRNGKRTGNAALRVAVEMEREVLTCSAHLLCSPACLRCCYWLLLHLASIHYCLQHLALHSALLNAPTTAATHMGRMCTHHLPCYLRPPPRAW